MSPDTLANELGISPKTLRAWLRREFPRASSDTGNRWELTAEQKAAARLRWNGSGIRTTAVYSVERPISEAPRTSGRDEHYVIDLCDEVLGMKAARQHCFEWLCGDPNSTGATKRLPVDAYYASLKLVVEYEERQHTSSVEFWNREKTVSGVNRDEQRRRYDQRRRDQIPRHGLRLIRISVSQLDANGSGKLRRNREHDLAVLRKLLEGCRAGI